MTLPVNDPPTLLAYLRENGIRYSTEALRDELVSQGQDPAAVDAAVEEYQHESTARGAQRIPVGPGCLVAAINLVPPVLGILGLYSGARASLYSIGGVVTLWIVELVAGIALLVDGRRRGETGKARWGSALVFGVLLVIALTLIVGGGCFGMLVQVGSGLGNHPREDIKGYLVIGLLAVALLVALACVALFLSVRRGSGEDWREGPRR